MCGRSYETYTDEELAIRYLNKKKIELPEFHSNYNFCPTQKSPIVLERDGERTIEMFRWGLVPKWAESVKAADKYSMINAKSEEISEKRSYKNAFINRRCIWPVSGFYEWKKDSKGKKHPFAIYLKDKSIASIAGIWESWVSKETGEIVDSFAVLTTSANKFMESIHHRMPVILSPTDEADWIDPENKDPDDLKKLLKPCPSKWLAAHEVSTKVNSPRNNRPELLEPI